MPGFRSYHPSAFRLSLQRGRVGRSMLQRQCACGSRSESGSECTECAEKDRLLQRKATMDRQSQVPGIVYDVLRTPGQPLESESRTFMEARFGYDFSGVRIHTDTDAHRSAEATTSDAYTVGRDIVFAPGRYAPGTSAGQRLLAHELTHVVQQDSSAANPSAIEMERKDEHERNADDVASDVVQGSASVSSLDPAFPALQRQASGGASSAQPAQASSAPATSPCLEEVVGEDVPSLLEAGAVTIIEFGADWCTPCRDNKAALESICRRFRAQPPPVTVRFYSIDVEEPDNKVLSQPYTPSAIPHLYFYVGSTEKSHYNTGIQPDAMEHIVAEHVEYASTSGAWRGAKSGMKWGALVGGLAGLGGGIATESLGVLGGGLALGVGLGALIGGIRGAVRDDRKRGPKKQLRRPFQPKLRSGKSSDPLEREADFWAAHVADDNIQAPTNTSYLKARDSSANRGEPLNQSTLGLMETRFGYDFSHVRIHRDSEANRLTESMNAYAVTEGSKISFAADGYAPETSSGQEILAHELAHVVQNESGAPKTSETNLETEAGQAASAVFAGQRARVRHGSARSMLALSRRAKKTLAWAGLGAAAVGGAGALIGLGIASRMQDQPFGKAALIGGGIGAGLGLIAGGLYGLLSRRKTPVETNEAEAAIRKRYGAYLPGGVGPLHNATVHPVTHSELCTWYRCRFGEKEPCEIVRGWTDTGSEREPVESAEAEPECSNGRKLQHATRERPVIYFDKDQRDAGLMVHEGLHAYSSEAFHSYMRNGATEGVTEYFTRPILDDLNIPRGDVYDEELTEVKRFVPIVGEEKLKRAYFLGEMDPLEQTTNQTLGRCALSEWAFAVQLLNFDRTKPQRIVEGRNQNYCPKGETSTLGPEMAAPPPEGLS